MQKLSVGNASSNYATGATPVPPETAVPTTPGATTAAMPVSAAQTFTPATAPGTAYTSPTQKGVSMKSKKSMSMIGVVVIGVAIAGGVFTGLGAARLSAKSGSPLGGSAGQPIAQVAGDSVKAGDVFGSPDESTFKDSAEGYLEIGGLDGEGTHKLVREGGDSQTVYLTSSVTDLSKFDGMEVKVWGETFKAQKAGWLMDVGRVQVVNTQGSKPSDE